MNETHSLLLNEDALGACPDAKKPIFIYEWLRYLDRILPITHKADLKSVQSKLQQQLEGCLTSINGPPTRQLLARCIAKVFTVGDSYSLFGTISMCNDTLKCKDDSPSQLPAKLAALTCLAALYENVGRLVGRTYEDSFTIMAKWLKSAESQGRAEIILTLTSMVTGLGSAGANIHKDLYKIARTFMSDRVMSVRIATIQCITALVPLYPPLYTTELEGTCTLCVKALDGSNYETRLAVANLFASLLSVALQPPVRMNMDDLAIKRQVIGMGGVGGFLKSSFGSTATVGGQKDVRVGVAMGYVSFIQELGAAWLERNLSTVCRHFLDIAAKCGGMAYTNSALQTSEAVFLRRCVSYIFRSTVGSMLSENAQIAACKYLGTLLAEAVNSFGGHYSIENGDDRMLGSEAYSSVQTVVVAVLELSALVRQIGTAVTPLFVEASGIMEPVFACLLHPILSARVATAWCLRCVTLAVPSQLTPLIDRCISRLEHMKACSDAISGYSLALAALISAAADCKLGLPHAKPKQVLICAEDMLKTATQQSRLAAAKINAGFILLNALASLGDAFSWQCSLEQRSGALSVMCAVAAHHELLDDETLKAMILPVECALIMSAQVGALVRSYGIRMRFLISVIRVRLYNLLMLLPVRSYDHIFAPLLRELVAEATLSDDQHSTSITSLASSMCSGAEHTLFTPWSGITDQAMVEDQLHAQSLKVGAPENDFTCLISGSAREIHDLWPDPEIPQLACLNTAIQVYGRIFALVPDKQKLQITEHFSDVIKNCKQVQRQQSIHLNVLCAMTLSFRSLCDLRGPRLGNEPLRKVSIALIEAGLESSNAVVRAVAAETMGRLSQAVGDPQFVALRAQFCFDKLKAIRDVRRGGYALTLGCVHRHVGSLGSGQHLHTGVSILLALALDQKSPLVQAWALIALSLIADSGGGMFRGYVELALSDCLTLLLNTHAANVELSALMTCVGPELSCPGTIEGVRGSLLAACAVQLAHPDPLVKAEAIAGLQQMHLYAPRYVHLNYLVTDIVVLFIVREHAQVLVPQGIVDEGKKLPLPDTGLEGALFGMLDVETNPQLRAHIQETIISLLHATCGEHLNQWLSLCKDILATSTDCIKSTLVIDEKNENEGDEDEGGDDDVTLQGVQSISDKGKVQPHWPTRVFATEVVQRLMSVCDTERAHLDLVLAKELQMSSENVVRNISVNIGGRADYLVLHLSDLVRMSFMGATSDNTELRLAGLNSLQVGAALRPAFTEDTPSHVTAAACQVCSTWIGSGVARDLNDLRRVHQACKEYYRSSWPSVLLASAIWLKNTNFQLPNNNNEAIVTFLRSFYHYLNLFKYNYCLLQIPETWPDVRPESRFHLMIGISVEALCSRTIYADDTMIQTCVRSISSILDCDWCKLHLMSDVQVPIELCNVLHRLILTRDNLTTQQLCVDCAHAIITAAKYSMRVNSSVEKNNESTSTNCAKMFFVGQEGSPDGVDRGSTLTYSLMELCLCLMVRQMKCRSLAPMHFRRVGRLPAESTTLIINGIQLLVQIPSLCSPQGRMIILPVVLYLVIGFIRESARIDENSVVPDLPPGHLTLVASTALQALRNLASEPPNDSSLPDWETTMQSAFYSILLLCNADIKMDECVLMLSCIVLVSVAPRSVVFGHRESFHRLIRLIKSQLSSPHNQVVSKTLQSICSLFVRRDICAPFVKHLGGPVFDVIRLLVTGDNVDEKVKKITDDRLQVVQDAIKALEVLVTTADEKRRPSLVSLIIQSLCRLICATNADEWRQLSSASRCLHEFAIGRLNMVAPGWPKEFKNVLSSHPYLKARLEGALMVQSNRQMQAQQAAKAKKTAESKVSTTQQPAIKLTMDFTPFRNS
uniref:HEAT repeat-containing protein 5B n=1 Tax=Heterorhabditis bacteriophora TaxID=37862 RepID=A0A1I7XVG7_HETBA